MIASKRALCLMLFLLIGIWTIAGVEVYAQGVIVPGPCRRCSRPAPPTRQLPGALPVKSIQIETKLSGQVATTHVEQVFRNDTDFVLEGTYFFPIPETASISEFAIWDGNNRLVGEVRSREEARRIYDEIVRRQRDPGLLEYAGRDLFQASIYPIPARSDKKLEITYTQVLTAEAGTVAYRYPLGTGRQMNVPIGMISGRVEIDGDEPIRNVYSPSHTVDVTRRNERHARLTFESKGKQEAPQDFQLFYTLSNDDFGLSLVTHREPGKQGYFLLMLAPKDELSEEEYAAKDIVFVLDTSGSMAAAGKMEKARAVMLFGISSLRAEDRFNVISFAGEERLMHTNLIAADAAGKARAEAFVKSLRATGGTNINDSLQAGLKQFGAADDRPKMLIFMTDGLPTVGETNATRIIENARAKKPGGVRLFTFGVGYDVNTALLDKLAADNSGVADYVEPKEDIEQKISTFFAKVSHPVLTDLELDLGGVETDLVYPRNLPDIFKGTQLALIGRYRNEREMRGVRLRLTGKTNRQARSFAYEKLRFPLTEDDHDFLPRLWATRRVGWLMEQVRTNGEEKELRDEIVDLGTRYGIVTPYTSYLALESNATSNSFTSSGQDPQFDRPRDLSAPAKERSMRRAPTSGGVSGPVPMASADSARLTTGAPAVQASKQARAQQETVMIESEELSAAANRKSVGGKTFYLRDNVWTDAEFKAETLLPVTSLVFASDEYYALLKREPRLAQFFSIGERVVVIYGNRIYRVNARAL
ncbi:MAG: VIT and VWA domain-containing protein [Pyrinomonadaceae bacterium]